MYSGAQGNSNTPEDFLRDLGAQALFTNGQQHDVSCKGDFTLWDIQIKGGVQFQTACNQKVTMVSVSFVRHTPTVASHRTP